jgi:hypothetical protein
MSNNYQPVIAPGTNTKWIAPSQISVQIQINQANPLQNIPTVNIIEQQVLAQSDGSVVVAPVTMALLSYVVTDPTTTFNLLDSSGNVIGTATDGQLLQLLHSKYVSIAQARDAE